MQMPGTTRKASNRLPGDARARQKRLIVAPDMVEHIEGMNAATTLFWIVAALSVLPVMLLGTLAPMGRSMPMQSAPCGNQLPPRDGNSSCGMRAMAWKAAHHVNPAFSE